MFNKLLTMKDQLIEIVKLKSEIKRLNDIIHRKNRIIGQLKRRLHNAKSKG